MSWSWTSYILGAVGGGCAVFALTYRVVNKETASHLVMMQQLEDRYAAMAEKLRVQYVEDSNAARRHIEALAGSVILRERGIISEGELRHDTDEALDNIYPLVRPRVERHVYGDIGRGGQYPDPESS